MTNHVRDGCWLVHTVRCPRLPPLWTPSHMPPVSLPLPRSHYAPGGNYFECATGPDGQPDCNSFVKNVFTVSGMGELS